MFRFVVALIFLVSLIICETHAEDGLYFQPHLFVCSDQFVREKDTLEVSDIMSDVREWYAYEMSDNGYGFKTFDYKEIKVVRSKKPLGHFKDGMFERIDEYIFGEGINVIFIVGLMFIDEKVVVRPDGVELLNRILGVAKGRNTYIPLDVPTVRPTTAHEIGHNLGLDHPDQAKPAQIMNFWNGGLDLDDRYLSKDSAMQIKDNPFLNEDDSLSVSPKHNLHVTWASIKYSY